MVLISTPRDVEEATEQLSTSRCLELRIKNPFDFSILRSVEGVMPLMTVGGTTYSVDAHAVDAFLKLLKDNEDNAMFVEMVATRQLIGITAELAETMAECILPAIHASHHLAIAQALEILLSSGVVEDLQIVSSSSSAKDFEWGRFFQRALSSHESRLRALTIRTVFYYEVRRISTANDDYKVLKVLDMRGSRELCAALSESNHLRELVWNEELYEEEEEELSRAIMSPGCNLETLHVTLSREPKGLRSALLHPNCKIRDFGLKYVSYCDCRSAEWGDHVLRDQRNKLLTLHLETFHWEAIPWEAMKDPACNVERLFLVDYSREHSGELAKLLRTYTSKIWYLHLDIYASKDVIEALEHSQITHLSFSSLQGEECELAVAHLLGAALCKLVSFTCITRDAQILLSALEMNYQSRLHTLELSTWDAADDENTKQRCQHIVQRNALFQNSTQEPFVPATSAKLFICGHSGAGKTTLARNLTRRVTLPSTLQRHSTTQGIDMGVLNYGGKKAVICDIAGQTEFHAFHHYFVKGSQSNIFLIVCKVLNNGPNRTMRQEFIYWLRFISSHRALASRRKPKVLIALNFHGRGQFYKGYSEVVNELAQQYSNLLDIHKVEGGNMCFEVVALRVADLKPLKDAIGAALEEMLMNHPLVPSLCKEVRELITGIKKSKWWWWICRQESQLQQKVATIEDLTQRLLPGDENNKAARISAVKFTMACMHDMGESLYFGVDFDNDEDLVNNATLDMQWFVQVLIGIFIQVTRDDDSHWKRRRQEELLIQRREDNFKVCMLDIAPKIEKICSPDQLSYVLKALHKLGVLLPFDDEWNGTWSRVHPKEVIVPALLENEFRGTNWGTEGYIYWGRRMACKDLVCTLLPAGIFNIVQVKSRELCKNPSFRLGKGWICFGENSVCVVVRVGGDTDHWVDRQWVDIMVMAEVDSKRCLLAEDIAMKIKGFIAKECQSSLNLVEYVINPAHIKARVHDNERKAAETMVVPLKKVHEEALEEGLNYSHTWDIRTSTEVVELFFFKEMQSFVKDWQVSIQVEYQESVASVYNLPEVELWENFFDVHNDQLSIALHPELMKVFMQILRSIDHRLIGIEAGINDLKAGINDLKEIARHTQQAMKLYGQEVLALCSRMSDKLNVSCPRYPFFVDINNKIAKNCLVVAKRIKLHYCCESSQGIHHVDGVSGLELELAHDWFKTHSHIIVPALTGLYFTLKIAGKALGAGDIFDFVLDFSKDKVRDIVGSVLTPELARNKRKPAESDLNEIFAMVENKVGGKRMDHFMMKTFGLEIKKQAWLCNRCSM
ncbi:hypothetical protein L7F22_047054 [Adiantum nelumboides]|nr:hypothetical protein [Adiantum nelumboides]